MNLTSHRPPQHVESAQCCEFNTTKDTVENLYAFLYLKHIENILGSKSALPPPPLPRMETNTGPGAPLSNHMAEP